MPCTVRDLLARPDLALGLVVAGPPGALDRPLAWAHSTELVDPGPFVEAGGILLTTGLQLLGERGAEHCATLVASLDRAGGHALGLGTGVHHDTVPDALVAAAAAAGLPLVEVPPPTPFLAVTRVLARAHAHDDHERLRRDHHRHRRLVAAAAAPGAVRALVRRTAELLGGWAALVDEAGRVVQTSRAGVGDAAAAAVAGRQARTGDVVLRHDGRQELAGYPLTSPTGRPLGYLVTGAEGPVGTLDHSILSVAATLLALAASRTARADRLMRQLRAASVRRLLAGETRPEALSAPEVWGGLPRAPVVVGRVTGTPEALVRAQDVLDPWQGEAPDGPDPVAFGEVGEVLWVLVSQQRAADTWRTLAAAGGLVTGASEPVAWEEVPAARASAAWAWRLAADTGAAFASAGERATTLAGAAGAGAVAALARVRLAPLLGRGDDLAVLRAWLARHGQHEPAARDLGLHRHTVRRRVEEIGRLLDVDLDHPTVRAELWLACAALQDPDA